MARYIYLIDVKCVAPANYKPRTSTYKGIAFSGHKNISDQLKEKAINGVREELEKQNPGAPLKFTASVSVRKNTFILDIDAELADVETIRIPLDMKEDGQTTNRN